MDRIKPFLQRKEFINSVWNIAEIVILPVMMLLVTPYFIKKLGSDQYGIWMFVNSITASIGIVNIGAGDAAIKFISKYRALDDEKEINRIINTGFSIVSVIVLLIIGMGICISVFVDSFNPFHLVDTFNALAGVSILLGSIIFAFKQVEQFIVSIFKGYERYDIGGVISITSKIVLLLSQILVVVLGYHLVQIFIISAIISVGAILIEMIYLGWRFKQFSFSIQFNSASLKEIFNFSIWSWFQSILSVIVGHIDRLIVLTLAGPTFLAYYALGSMIGTQVHSIFTAGAGWVFPKVSAKTERNEEISQLYFKMQFIVIAFGFLVVASLLVFEKYIFETWLGVETYTNAILLIKIFLYLAFFNMLSIIPYFFLLGANRIRISALFMLMSVVVTIIFMLLGYRILDYSGLAYGKLVSSILTIPVTLYFVHSTVIGGKNANSGFALYIAAGLLALAAYFANFVSIILVIGGIVLLYVVLKKNIVIRTGIIR